MAASTATGEVPDVAPRNRPAEDAPLPSPYLFIQAFCCLLILCFPFLVGFMLYAASEEMEFRAGIRAVIQVTLADRAFMGEAARAGYRIERVDHRGMERLVARCARANEVGPLPCDPAPTPPGLDRRFWTVVP